MTRAFLLAIVVALLAGCAGPAPYVYRYVPGKTAVMHDGFAVAPPEAPEEIRAAIAGENRIAGLPYARGGGHAHSIDSAYDFSGAASYVLQATGRLDGSMPSVAFRRYGESGKGKWISIYARRDHVFLVVAGLHSRRGRGERSRGGHFARSRHRDRDLHRAPIEFQMFPATIPRAIA